jgi:pimeloyl-ACP methyl ester carboxylesterase
MRTRRFRLVLLYTGSMKPVLVCLHGWGGDKTSFTELREALKGVDIEILTPDLPGFGDEPEPDHPWTVDEYADWVERWVRSQESGARNDLYLLGHSHGGRISLKLAARGSLPIKHLYLCAAAGIRHPRHIKRMIGLTLAKAGSFFLAIPGLNKLQPLAKKLLYKLVRVHDYEKASPVMRDTLIKVTQEDLRPLLSSINIPTDIFWGTDDGMTPVSDAYVMHKDIRGSRLHLYQGVRHRVHRDKAADIAAVITSCL